VALTTHPTFRRIGHLPKLDTFFFGPFSGLIIRQLESKQAPATGALILHTPGMQDGDDSSHLGNRRAGRLMRRRPESAAPIGASDSRATVPAGYANAFQSNILLHSRTLAMNSSMHMLLVEDNRDLAANVGEFLELRGYVVEYAEDGLTGLHLAATHRYDALVLDLGLPGIDGLALCKRRREDARSIVGA
jgi:response regulator receiver domain-containing protein